MHGEYSRIGATSSRSAQSGKPTMGGSCWLAYRRSPKIAERSQSTRVRKAAASTRGRGAINLDAGGRNRVPRNDPASMGLAFLLAVWTGQRQGDLLRLPWSGYDGSWIRLRQSKTGARVAIPVGGPLKLALDEAAKRKGSTVILTNSTGNAWKSMASDHPGARLVPRQASKV